MTYNGFIIMETAVTLLLQGNVYEVEAFHGKEGINTPFHFTISLLINAPGINNTLGKKATLSLPSMMTDKPRQWCGIINTLEVQTLINTKRLTLTITHPLSALASHKQEQEFYHHTQLEVACALLKKHHIPFELLGITPDAFKNVPLLHQVKEECDLAFFHQLLRKVGLKYFIKEDNKLCLFSRFSYLSHLENDTLHYLPRQKNTVPGMPHFYDLTQHKNHQKKSTSFFSKSTYVIKSGLSHIKAARHVNIILSTTKNRGDWHVISKIEHYFEREKKSYHNLVSLQEIKNTLPKFKTNSPYSKITTAKIHAGEQCANLNALGSYQYRLSSRSEQTERMDDLESQPYIPRLASYGGSHLKGISFPLQKNDEILIAYLNGRPETPFIIANINRAYRHPKRTSKNKHQTLFSLSNHMAFTLNDENKKNIIALQTKFNEIELSAAEDNHHITINTAGFLTIKANKNIEIEAQDQKLSIKHDALYDAKDSYQVTVNNNYYEKIKHSTQIKAESYQAKTIHRFQIKATNLIWKVESKSVLNAKKGSIHLQSAKVINLKTKVLSCQSDEKIEIGLRNTFFKLNKNKLEFHSKQLKHTVKSPIAYFGKINHLSGPQKIIKQPPVLAPKIIKHEIKELNDLQSLFNLTWSSNGVNIKNKALACFQVRGYKKGDRGRVIIYQCTPNNLKKFNTDSTLETPLNETLKEVASVKFKIGDPSLYPFAFEYNNDPGTGLLNVPWTYHPLPKSQQKLTYYRFEIELLSEKFDNYSEGLQWLKDIELTHKKHASIHAIKVIRTQLSKLTLREHDTHTHKRTTYTLPSETLQPLEDNKALIKNVPLNGEHQLFLLSKSEKWQEVISHDNQSVSPYYPLIPSQDNKSEKREIQSLHPPIIMNLNDVIFDKKSNEPLIENPSDEHARLHLTEDELTYFKNNGNNVTIFIHGFNVPYGQFGEYIESLEYVNLKIEDLTKGLNFPQKHYELRVKKSSTKKTIKLNFDEHIKNLDNPLSSEDLKFSNDYEPLRNSIEGVGMHSWLTDFEDNLNNAAGFNKDYSEFTRALFIAWPGEPKSPADYMTANAQSKKTGRAFAEVLLQLRNFSPDMEINVIAHSQGNGVMLSAFDYLGEYHASKKVNHAFVWQAALPFTALNGESESTGINPHYLSIDIKQKVERDRKTRSLAFTLCL